MEGFIEISAKVLSPAISSFAKGLFVPIPSLLFTLSQKKFELFCEYTPLAPAKTIEPWVNWVVVPVPPRVTPRLEAIDHVPLDTVATPVKPEELIPVPPYWAPIAVPFHVPLIICPEAFIWKASPDPTVKRDAGVNRRCRHCRHPELSLQCWNRHKKSAMFPVPLCLTVKAVLAPLNKVLFALISTFSFMEYFVPVPPS